MGSYSVCGNLPSQHSGQMFVDEIVFTDLHDSDRQWEAISGLLSCKKTCHVSFISTFGSHRPSKVSSFGALRLWLYCCRKIFAGEALQQFWQIIFCTTTGWEIWPGPILKCDILFLRGGQQRRGDEVRREEAAPPLNVRTDEREDGSDGETVWRRARGKWKRRWYLEWTELLKEMAKSNMDEWMKAPRLQGSRNRQ